MQDASDSRQNWNQINFNCPWRIGSSIDIADANRDHKAKQRARQSNFSFKDSRHSRVADGQTSSPLTQFFFNRKEKNFGNLPTATRLTGRTCVALWKIDSTGNGTNNQKSRKTNMIKRTKKILNSTAPILKWGLSCLIMWVNISLLVSIVKRPCCFCRVYDFYFFLNKILLEPVTMTSTLKSG